MHHLFHMRMAVQSYVTAKWIITSNDLIILLAKDIFEFISFLIRKHAWRFIESFMKHQTHNILYKDAR